MSRRRAAAVATALLAALPLAGCSSDLTADRVQTLVDTGFTNLYLRQQALLAAPQRSPEWVSARSSCRRWDDLSPAAGAGGDWQCAVSWRAVDGTPLSTVLDVELKPDGCLRATSPPGSTGDAVLLTAQGRRVNPLAQFDLCLPEVG